MADTEPASDQAEGASALLRAAVIGMLVILAAVLIGGLLLLRTVVPTVGSDLETARLRTQRLLPMTLPPGFPPTATLDWNMLYLIPMEGVWIDGGNGGVITLLHLGGRVAADDTLRRRAADALQEQVRGSADVESTDPMDVVVRGRAETIDVLTLRDRQTGEQFKAFSRSFATPDGPVFLEW